METKLIKLDATQFGVEKSRAKEMESAFVPMINTLKEMEAEYNALIKKSNNGITKELCDQAHTLRWQYVKLRKGVDEVHQVGKKEVLLLGRAWDGLKNQYLSITNQNEETLNKIEKHFEIMEADRKAKLKEEREKLLLKYEIETEYIQLGEMNNEVWDNYFTGVKLQHENKIAAERKAMADQIAKEKAEKAEWERIKKDNERLRREEKLKEKAMQIEREKADAKKKVMEEQARKEREAFEIKAQKEAEAREKVEAELQAKKDAEAKAKADKQAAIEAELSADDKDKFVFIITALAAVKDKYTFKSEKYKNLQKEVNELIDKIIVYSHSKID